MLEEMENKGNAGRIIDSAIGRTLDPSIPSTLTDESDITFEETIINALNEMLKSLGRHKEGSPQASPPEGQSEAARAAQVAEDAVRNMPRPALIQVQNSVEATNGVSNGNGLKHRRSVTTDESDQPNGKRRFL